MQACFSLYTIRPEGRELRLLVERLPGPAQNLEWSPDGTRLALILSTESGDDLYGVRADGSGLTGSPRN